MGVTGLVIGLSTVAGAQGLTPEQEAQQKKAQQQAIQFLTERQQLRGPVVGSAAPDFTVKDIEGKNTVTLSALKGKPVLLIFGSCT
jgi:cytochrome oxidase Cu insertion factor (SCO1/SenC/PrrC family)